MLEALSDPDARYLAAGWLADAGETAAVPGLIRLLDASDWNVRRVAAESLGKLKAGEAGDRLLEMAEHDPSSFVRGWAIYAVAQLADADQLGDRDVVPLLISFLNDPHWALRNGASSALALLADPRALEPLRQARRRERGLKNWYLTHSAYRRAIRAIKRNNPV
jgi:HEAT repeat protein